MTNTEKRAHPLWTTPALPYVLPLIISIAGLVLLLRGNSYPQYSDPDAFEIASARGRAELERSGSSDRASEVFYRVRQQYQTPHTSLVSSGRGCVSLGISIALLFWFLQVRSFLDFLSIRTPSSRTRYILLVNLTWLTVIGSIVYFFGDSFNRGDYPPWADSMGMPIFSSVFSGVVGLFVLNVVFGTIVKSAIFPALLFNYPINRSKGILLYSAIFCALLWFLLRETYAAIGDGDFLIVPAHIMAMYLFLSLHAGLCAATGTPLDLWKRS